MCLHVFLSNIVVTVHAWYIKLGNWTINQLNLFKKIFIHSVMHSLQCLIHSGMWVAGAGQEAGYTLYFDLTSRFSGERVV